MRPNLALMFVLPLATAVAEPLELMVATAGLEDVHTTLLVTSWVLLSLKVPVAVNGWVRPTAIDGLIGAIAIETNAGWTVNVVAPEMVPRVAVMVEAATPTPVASPVMPIVATEVLEDVQVTVLVMVFTLPSLYVPLATNCFVAPVAIVESTGVTLMDASAAAVTVRTVEPEMLPLVAVMVALP